MGSHIFRKATQEDRARVAEIIVFAFKEAFSSINRNLNRVANAIESSIVIDRFYLYELDGEILGVISSSDCDKRSFDSDSRALRQKLGFIGGLSMNMVFRSEFMRPLPLPKEICLIENVAVDEKARRRGIATAMLHELIAVGGYGVYILDVDKKELGAQQCYEKAGFCVVQNPFKNYRKDNVFMKYMGRRN